MGVIYVLAGTNGAGKSSVAAALFRSSEPAWFDPDAVAARLRALEPARSAADANAQAWRIGVALLQRAIDGDGDHAFETTLGGRTISQLLEEAASRGCEVRMLFVGLEGVERHLARVQARVARGGHDIPEDRIRARYDTSRANLIRLLPALPELRLIDNSIDSDLAEGATPIEILRVQAGRIVFLADRVPGWAKPVVAAALHLS